jgi:peptidoglycan hydrolase-like protein with peptidoglycan-binding domain
MQTALRRLGYYCGPIDGIFSAEVADAIARLQKNYSMRVTGTLTDPVRRALHMP